MSFKQMLAHHRLAHDDALSKGYASEGAKLRVAALNQLIEPGRV